jgi:hypothetical protein
VTGIQVLDLSDKGVLLLCDGPLGVAHRTRLHMLIGCEPFVASIEVTRVQEVRRRADAGVKRYLVGAVFTSMDDKSAGSLRRFLPSRPQPAAPPRA